MRSPLTLLFLLATVIVKAQVSHLDRAITVPEYIDSIIVIEKTFSVNDSTPPPKGKNWFEFKPGKLNILVVAGHATAQMREGKIKRPDSGTGSIALELHKLLDIPILYTTYLSPSDPNYYDDNAFKDTLAKVIAMIKPAFVIDLHGSHPYRPYDIDFGTLNGKSFLSKAYLFDSLIAILNKDGLENLSQDYFSADKNQTITKFVYNKGIPCVQLEINSVYLSANEGNIYAQKTAELLQALIRFIEMVARQ